MSTDSRVGTTFGVYELTALLGKGGMGEVYQAYDTVKGRSVAVKILREQFADDEQFRARFLRESSAAAILQEPHVIPIHDWGEIDGNLFIDMRLVRGQTLYELVEHGPLEPQRAVTIVDQIGAALDAAHAERLIHRDVKPQNIIVTPADFAYLVDFGIVENQGDTRLTMAGTQIGSLAYMAPERLSDAQCTYAADVYSLACVLYEALTGDTPFRSDSYEHLIASHLSAPPPRPSAINPRVSASLDDVIARGMAKEPDDRYGSAGALGRAALRALQSIEHDVAPNAETMVAAHVSSAPVPISPYAGAERVTRPTDASEGPDARSRRSLMPLAVGIAAALLLGALGLVLGVLVTRSSGPSTSPSPTAASMPTYTVAESAVTQTVPPATITKTATVTPSMATPLPQQSSPDLTGVVVGTCDEGGSCGVKQRNAPYNDAPPLYSSVLKDGTTVTVACQATGDVRASQGHGSSYYWYRLDNGAYVNSVYLDMSTSEIPTC
jgi:serine/threonine protein kinase